MEKGGVCERTHLVLLQKTDMEKSMGSIPCPSAGNCQPAGDRHCGACGGWNYLSFL